MIVNESYDHIHILYGRNPSVSTSDTVSVLKKSSAYFINEKKWFAGRFQWQDGYGAFSYSRNQIEKVYGYIANQERHHKYGQFRNEYKNMLQDAGIEYEERFLFNFLTMLVK